MGERRIFHRLVSLDDALNIINKYYPLKPLGIEKINITEALGRVLAEDIYSPIDHPPFDRSLVDGYAVRSTDLEGVDDLHPKRLKIIGVIKPGQKPDISIEPGETAEIATGAMIPRGADAVVMVEYTRRLDGEVEIYRSVVPGENISSTGNDISFGDLVLETGTRLGFREIGLLAGLGITSIKTYIQPKIAVFSTGDEVIEPWKKLSPGKVYDVNGQLITMGLRQLGADARFMGHLPDNYEEVYDAIDDALGWADIVITSGGTSAGVGDLVYRVFDEIGEPGIIIHGLKVKPGKPTVIAVAEKKLLFGLPGFPLSCFMIFNKIVKPVIASLMGLKKQRASRIKARLPYRIKKPLGKTWLLPVALVESEKGLTAYPVSMRSGAISPLYNSDGYLVLPEDRDLIMEDEEVYVELFDETRGFSKLNIIGSNDMLIHRILAESGLRAIARVIVTGSTGGWKAVKRGEADLAPTHLLDVETGRYNTPFLEKYGLKDKAVIIRGYDRKIGIVVQEGNPKNIHSIEDFLRPDVRIVNRTRGAGARVLLDILLRRVAEKKGLSLGEVKKTINGYTYEVKTHTAVAAAVKHGRADAGIAIEAAARLYGLDFIPLAWEEYDFLVLKDRLNKEYVKAFIEFIRDKRRIQRIASLMPGYKIPEDIGTIKSS